MADIVPAWMWGDPAEVVERLEAMSARAAQRVIARAREPGAGAVSGPRDRYYTMARRCEVRGAVKRVMRGGR